MPLRTASWLETSWPGGGSSLLYLDASLQKDVAVSVAQRNNGLGSVVRGNHLR